MGWPQIIYIVLIAVSLSMNLAFHGQRHRGNYNFWTASMSSAIIIWILYEGVFWNGI